MKRSKVFGHGCLQWLLIVGIACVVATAIPGELAWADKKRQVFLFDIHPQEITEALKEVAMQTGHQLLFSAEQTDLLASQPLMGSYSIEEALSLLLQGTGLSFEITARGVIVIKESLPTEGNGEMEMKTKKRLISGVISSLLGIGASQGALGQPEEGAVARLEEVIVTAQRREQTLQDTAVSVTAFTADGLRQHSLATFHDINNFVPNLELNSGRVDGGGSTAQIFMRGVGQEDFAFPMDPGVGVYLDGVYVSRSSAGDFSFLDLERIEVLRGPQGTLYGKNTIGGAVNVITQKPTGSNTGSLEFTVGRFDRMDVSGSFDARLTDTVSARISAASFNSDGIGKSFAGDELGDINRDMIRGQFRWEPNERLDVIVAADKSRQRQHGPLGSLRAYSDYPLGELYNDAVISQIAQELGLSPPFDDYGPGFVNKMDKTEDRYSWGGTQTKNENDVEGISLVVDYEFDTFTLKSISAYRSVEFEVASDGDHTPFPVNNRFVQEKTKQYSQEFQILGSLFDDRMNYIVGLYGIHEKGDSAYQAEVLAGIEDVLGDILSQSASSDIKATSYAVFGEFTYNFTDNLGLTLGARFNWEEKDYKLQNQRLYSGEIFIGPYDVSESWTEFLPKVGVEYAFSDDILLYSTYSEGYKAGGWNPRPDNPSLPFIGFDPEYLKSYEVGVKTTILDGRGTLNLAAFYSDYEDMQLVAVDTAPDGNSATWVANAGDGRIYGLEAELALRVTNSLFVTSSLGLLDAKYTSLDQRVIDLGMNKNNDFIQTPEVTFNFAANYTWVLDNAAEISLAGDAAYKSDIHRSVQNFDDLHTPSYWIFNSRMTFIDPEQRYELSAFVRNITNEIYMTNGVDVRALGWTEAYYSRPREWGMSVKFNF